jgi:hypothetical protein
MIMASVALEYKLIDKRIFVALIVMAIVTSIISAPMLQYLTRKEMFEKQPQVQVTEIS